MQIKPYELDFYLADYNIAIEFNGDYWHMNPTIYQPTDIHKHTKKLAQEIWDRDQFKQQLCKEKGLTLITIWESDWNLNKEQIKQNILRLIH